VSPPDFFACPLPFFREEGGGCLPSATLKEGRKSDSHLLHSQQRNVSSTNSNHYCYDGTRGNPVRQEALSVEERTPPQRVQDRRVEEAEHGEGAEGDVSWCELRRCGRRLHLEVSGRGVTGSQLIACLLEHMRTQAPLSWPINGPVKVICKHPVCE